MSLNDKIKKLVFGTLVVGTIGINYDCGYKFTCEAMSKGLTFSQSEQLFEKKYSNGTPTCILLPLTLPGRVIANLRN